jgi:putative ATP-dependent endonuclease of OLD family
LLIPIFAKRLGHDLSREHISVVPICGVAFETFKKLLGPAVLDIPVAIVSDADPAVARGDTWETDSPEVEGTAFKLCDRMKKLLGLFNGHASVGVFNSKLTLEYDLAAAGDGNAAIMASVWESCFVGTPRTFNGAKVTAAGPNRSDKALTAWRGICRAEHAGSKAEFAHRLSATLALKKPDGEPETAFEVPEYIKLAVEHVINALRPPAPTAGVAMP